MYMQCCTVMCMHLVDWPIPSQCQIVGALFSCWGLVYLLGGIVLGDIMRPIVGGLHMFVCHDWKTRSNPYSFRAVCPYIKPEACPVQLSKKM